MDLCFHVGSLLSQSLELLDLVRRQLLTIALLDQLGPLLQGSDARLELCDKIEFSTSRLGSHLLRTRSREEANYQQYPTAARRMSDLGFYDSPKGPKGMSGGETASSAPVHQQRQRSNCTDFTCAQILLGEPEHEHPRQSWPRPRAAQPHRRIPPPTRTGGICLASREHALRLNPSCQCESEDSLGPDYDYKQKGPLLRPPRALATEEVQHSPEIERRKSDVG